MGEFEPAFCDWEIAQPIFCQVFIVSDQRLPNLYQLLGLSGADDSREKIVIALKRAQARLDALKAGSRTDDAAKLQRVIGLGQKYLLNAENKAAYDAQWQAIYAPIASVAGQAAKAQSVASSPASVAPRAVANAAGKPESAPLGTTFQWDMSSLEALLPEADPHAPFQMADYMRTSQVRDPMAAEADLNKLISLLGGEVLPTAAPVIAQPIAQPIAMSQPIEATVVASAEPSEQLTDAPLADTGLVIPRSASTSAGVALAKRMRKKRQRALWLGGLGW